MSKIENLIRILSKKIDKVSDLINIPSYEQCFLDSGEYLLNKTITSISNKESDSILKLPLNPIIGDYYIVENKTTTKINISVNTDNYFLKKTGLTTADDFILLGKSSYKFTALSKYNNKIVWRIEILDLSINSIVDTYAHANNLSLLDLHNSYGTDYGIGFKVYCPNIITGGKCYTLIDDIVESWVSESITKLT